jgi:hypothetical protein
MGSMFKRARSAAGKDVTLRKAVEKAHLRCGGPTAAELLEAGEQANLFLLACLRALAQRHGFDFRLTNASTICHRYAEAQRCPCKKLPPDEQMDC